MPQLATQLLHYADKVVDHVQERRNGFRKKYASLKTKAD